MYRFDPIVKKMVWGTERWVVSAVPGYESVVAEGPMRGKTISDIFPGEFPLLVKFIDAGEDLSIQVHPGDELAYRRHGCKGKTEMWYVIDAAPSARLLCGWKKPMAPEAYEGAVCDGTITDYLNSYDVKAGDVFYVPSGRIHAIGAGCHIAEIQETSDVTYRIYDYGRAGLDGKPRQLHTSEAKDAIDYTFLPDYRTHYTAGRNRMAELVRSPFFNTSMLEADSEYSCRIDSEYLIVMCVEGSAEVNGTPISAGQAGLIIAENRLEIRPSPSVRLLFSA